MRGVPRPCVAASDSVQNMCPPMLPGTTVKASAADAKRGILPVASNSPPPICTAALNRAKVSASAGHVRADRIRQLAHALERRTGRVRGGFGVPKGIHPLPDKCH